MKKIIGLLIILICSIFMIRALFVSGYFPMHDDTQVARVVVMGRALREGQFPVRWVSDLGYGYGYPIFNFYGPLPYYVGGFLYALGLSGLTATKLMMGAGLVLAGVTMYVAVADIVGVSAGVLASVFYMYAPYHAVDAYVRGAVGEYYALIFLPLILWGFWKKKMLIGALGIAGLILSHTILGYAGMFLTGIAFIVVGITDRTRIKSLLVTIVLGLGLSAFFWLPALAEMKYTNVASVIGNSANFQDHFVCVNQLWNSQWGFGGSAKGCLDGMSFKVGKVHLLLGLVAFIGVFVGLIRARKSKILVIVGSCIFAVSVFFMLSISAPVWTILPLFAYVQYPWRFLAFAIFGISLVVSQMVFIFRNIIVRWVVVIVCIGFVLYVEAKWFIPQYTYARPAADFETAQDIRFRVSKISDEYLPAAIPSPKLVQNIVKNIVSPSDEYITEIQQVSDTYVKIAFHTHTSEKVKINIAYFPGWHYMVNLSEENPELQNGLPILTIPPGDTVVQMQFRNTPERTVANIISLVSLGVCVFLYDKHKKTIS